MRRHALLAIVLLTACRESKPVREFDAASAFRYIETQVDFGPRIPETDAHRRAAL